MPRIIIQAIPTGGEHADITLSERVAAANLNAPHYSAQLLERLTWATADAEARESRALGLAERPASVSSDAERGSSCQTMSIRIPRISTTATETSCSRMA